MGCMEETATPPLPPPGTDAGSALVPASVSNSISAPVGGGERQTLTEAAAGVVLAIVLALLVGGAASRFWVTDPHLVLVLSYLAVWGPLLGAVVTASVVHRVRAVAGPEAAAQSGFLSRARSGSLLLVRDIGWRFRPIDLLWGLSVGLLTRVVASLLEIALYGRMAPPGAILGTMVYDGWWLFGMLLAPVLIAPVVEEVFFRGLLLRAVRSAASVNGGGRSLSIGIAVVVSGAVFALVHVLQAGSGAAVVVIGLSTFVFGLAAATVAALTGRLGGAIIAHVTFNALVIVPALLAR